MGHSSGGTSSSEQWRGNRCSEYSEGGGREGDCEGSRRNGGASYAASSTPSSERICRGHVVVDATVGASAQRHLQYYYYEVLLAGLGRRDARWRSGRRRHTRRSDAVQALMARRPAPVIHQ
jgi:hypothetical protein